MNLKILTAVAVLAAGAASQSQAAAYVLSLTGDPTAFSESQFTFNNAAYDEFSLSLTGLDGSNAITVEQGDTISSTVTLSSAYTIGTAPDHTDILQYFFGSAFPAGNTGVDGTFNFYNGATLVASYGYSSTTSDQLASYAAIFSPNNPAFTFDSFTNDVNINALGSPATLDSSQFTYALVTPLPAPEPSTWAMMVLGVGAAGLMVRTSRRRLARVAV